MAVFRFEFGNLRNQAPILGQKPGFSKLAFCFRFLTKDFSVTGSLTRNSSTDLTDFKTRNEKRKVYNALAAASIFKNSAGVDTSRRQVVPMDAFLHFLSHFQKEQLSEEEVKQLIEVSFFVYCTCQRFGDLFLFRAGLVVFFSSDKI